MTQRIVKVWDYPEELRWLEEPPRTMREWTEDEQARALICLELRRQHELLMQLVDLLDEQDLPVAQEAPSPLPARGVEVSESGY